MCHYLGFAAGSGMAPLLPAIGTILAGEPASHVTLVYENETSSAVPLREELLRLKDRYLERLALLFVMSREPQEIDAFTGPLDGAKVAQLLERWIDLRSVDRALISAPAATTRDVQAALAGAGLDAARIAAAAPGAAFSLSLDDARDDTETQVADGQAPVVRRDDVVREDVVRVSLAFEGKEYAFEMARRGEPVLDAALRAGIDLPYSCRSGVCGTCRARLTAGEVDIDVNYVLEDDEIARGAILMCQSYPLTADIAVSVTSAL